MCKACFGVLIESIIFCSARRLLRIPRVGYGNAALEGHIVTGLLHWHSTCAISLCDVNFVSSDSSLKAAVDGMGNNGLLYLSVPCPLYNLNR